jgi:hypothetical protein
VIVLDHTPICPLCSDVLLPDNLSSLLGVVFCSECATRARSAHWPEPYDFGHVFAARDLMSAAGLRWYHPFDHTQETAFSRHERLESAALDAERFRLSRLN